MSTREVASPAQYGARLVQPRLTGLWLVAATVLQVTYLFRLMRGLAAVAPRTLPQATGA